MASKAQFCPLDFTRRTVGKSLPGTSHKVMPKGPAHCLTAHILLLSLQPEGLVTPIHLPGVNVRESLKVLEVTEMSSPNETTLCRLPKQPLCRRALKLWGFILFRLLSQVGFPTWACAAIASCTRPGQQRPQQPHLKSRWHRPVVPPGTQTGLQPTENGYH